MSAPERGRAAEFCYLFSRRLYAAGDTHLPWASPAVQGYWRKYQIERRAHLWVHQTNVIYTSTAWLTVANAL